MKRYSKWVMAGVALTTIGVLVGCGQVPSASGVHNTSVSSGVVNQTTNSTTNSVSNTPANELSSTASSQVTFETQTLTIEPNVTVSFQTPSGWNKQNAGGGDTGGGKWVNPTNPDQWVRILYSGNVGALQNNGGNYDVESYINTPGVTWTSVSSDKLSGQFTVPTGAINNTSVGYGYAQVITSPNPVGVNVEAVAPKNIAQTVTQSVKVQAGSTAANVMPKPKGWTDITNDNLKVNTDYGTVSFLTTQITKNDVSVYLTSSGGKSTLYTLHNANFKQIDGWQTDGQYLALRFGLPPSANPTTGDYGYEDVVIDLKAKQVALTSPSAVQSTDYLASPYFIRTYMHVAMDGTPEFFMNVTKLNTHQTIAYQLPKNTLGIGVVSKGTLYYTVKNGKAHQVISIPLPTSGWNSVNDGHQTPIQLPSRG